eukprot:TRINITY_DN23647_c0_g1_i1.p1 TRINITY_DN23647_c0_g1~~TRINITY_DN23647_c0_g1_i1.p1  ORF type:complete len:289 (-),score=68.91 TRINITY_DN23647_c0_g1_i1:192-1016(-)
MVTSAVAAPVVPSDVFPAIRRFLVECGLARTLRAFDRETCLEADSGSSTGLDDLDLLTACQFWVTASSSNVQAVAVAPTARNAAAVSCAADARVATTPKLSTDAVELSRPGAIGEVAAVPAVSVPGGAADAASARIKIGEAAAQVASVAGGVCAEELACESLEVAEDQEQSRKRKRGKVDKPVGKPFTRVDGAKWTSAVIDARMLDNSHEAKARFGTSAGDSWADRAAEDLLKVKGKDFRKEMAKKKRATWRGGGAIDQGVNSIKFDESSDEAE